MANTEPSPHLENVDLEPEVKNILEEIGQALENKWVRYSEALDIARGFENIRDMAAKLVQKREVIVSYLSRMRVTNSMQELRGKDFRFMRFKISSIFVTQEPVYLFPLKTHTEACISNTIFEVGKRISIIRDEAITPVVEILVVKQ